MGDLMGVPIVNLDLEDASRAQHDLMQIVIVVEIESVDDAETGSER